MIAFFLFALFCEDPKVGLAFQGWRDQAASRALDGEFVLAQEGFVWSEQNPPSHFLVTGLANDRYWTRKAAQDALGKKRWGALPLLGMALKSHDPEVRDAARLLINDVFRCPDCHGTGVCQLCLAQTWGCYCDYYKRCLTCSGSGDLRLKVSGREWVEREYCDVLAPRDYFWRPPLFFSKRLW